MPDYLMAPERETVLSTNDADGVWALTTHQRKIMTRLRKAGWEPVEDLSYHGQPGARYEIPYAAIAIRSRAAVERVSTEEERTAKVRHLRPAS